MGKTKSAVIWSAIDRFSVQGAQFFLSVVIARLVSPADYGLIAMLNVFLSVAQQFIDSGFSTALIQKRDRQEVDFYTVFYFNLIISLAIYGVLFLISPYIADFYSEPRLELITKCTGLNIVLIAFYIVPRAKFTIELDFKTQTKISLIAVLLSGIIGVLLAWYGCGVWALILQCLLNNLFSLLLYWGISRWKLKPKFSYYSFKYLFRFGSNLLGVGILHAIFANIYTLVIGRLFVATEVGFFNRSQSFATFPSMNISSMIARALYPIQCEMQTNDEQLKEILVKYLKMTLYVVLPLMMGLCVLSKPFIAIVLAERWLPMAKMLSVLCIAYMCYPFTTLNWQILTVKGRTDLALRAEVFGKSASFIILLLSLPFGAMGICYGIIIANIVDILIIIYYVKRVLSITYLLELKILLPTLTITIIMGVMVSFVHLIFENSYLQILIGSLIGLIIYIGLSYLFDFDEFRGILSVVNRKRNGKK